MACLSHFTNDHASPSRRRWVRVREVGREISTPSECSVESLEMLDQGYDSRSLAPTYCSLRVAIHQKNSMRTTPPTHGINANSNANASNNTNNENDNSDAEKEA